MPDQAMAVIPHPMGGIPTDAVRHKMQQAFPTILRELTDWQPARSQLAPPRVPRSLRVTGSVSDVYAEFSARGWCAGLPFIPPTRELVETLLTGTGHAA